MMKELGGNGDSYRGENSRLRQQLERAGQPCELAGVHWLNAKILLTLVSYLQHPFGRSLSSNQLENGDPGNF
jgi:hypothetical protein